MGFDSAIMFYAGGHPIFHRLLQATVDLQFWLETNEYQESQGIGRLSF